ncbi:MAG: bile acid:sodium symporter family protein [Candidatus Cyclobacteriaceae bacterium M2_1C_046]
MEDSVLTSVVLPVSLAIIMFGMGLSLIPDDFKRIFKYPKAALVGLSNQLILLPVIGFTLAYLFNLSPALAVGLMIIAVCPGGPTSNLITHVAKGDVALSISLTAITSFVTVFTIPFILTFSLNYFKDEAGAVIQLPVLKTIIQIMGITIIPVSIGMLVRHYRENFAFKMERPMRIASTVIFIAVLAGVILANKVHLIPYMKETGPVTLLLNLLTMATGFITAKIFNLNIRQSISITIESGIQNGTLAIVIATSILKEMDMSIPAATYSLLMFVTGGILMWFFGKRKEEPVLSRI